MTTRAARFRSCPPLVSFVIIGRNDNYMGDYAYRLGTSLSFLGESASRAGLLDDLEVLVVDWASTPTLAGVVPLGAEARRFVTFVEVPPSTVRSRFGGDRWVPTVAVNVGVRRALGEFIFFTDSDCLWTEAAMSALGRLLRGTDPLPMPVREIMCYVRRSQIPWATVHRRPRLAEWRRLTTVLAAGIRPESPAASCLGGFSAGQLMHRDLWRAVRGYDETLDRPWGWSDNDLMLRVSQQHAWLDISSFGFSGLHMEHWPQAEQRLARDPSTINPMVIHDLDCPNGEDWGLGDAVLPEETGTAPSPSAGVGCDVPLSGQLSTPTAGDWQPDNDATRLVHRVGADREPGAMPVPTLAALAQLARIDLPRNLLWSGPLEPSALSTIVAVCPAIELTCCNPWPPGVSDGLAFNPSEFARFIEATCHFKGWARIVQGPPDTAFERAWRSGIGHAPIEWAWLGPSTSPGFAGQVAGRLAPGGVVFMPAPGGAGSDITDRLRASGCCVHRLPGTDLIVATRPQH